MSTHLETAPPTVHRGEDDLPFVALPDGTELQLLQVDLAQGVWTVRTRFPAGIVLPTHKHTGNVYAFTARGRWRYLESPDAENTAGSYLFEPAGSTHTLDVPADNDEVTEVFFTIHGANLDLDTDGNVVSVLDAHSLLPAYRALCATQHGLDDPPVVVIDSI